MFSPLENTVAICVYTSFLMWICFCVIHSYLLLVIVILLSWIFVLGWKLVDACSSISFSFFFLVTPLSPLFSFYPLHLFNPIYQDINLPPPSPYPTPQPSTPSQPVLHHSTPSNLPAPSWVHVHKFKLTVISFHRLTSQCVLVEMAS
jgi:hypothetical protein